MDKLFVNLEDPRAARVLDALGHRTRRMILLLLRDRPRAVGEIATFFPINRPAISKHLRILRYADLVEPVARGASNIFYLKQSGFDAAKSFLDIFWDEALRNFELLIQNQQDKHS